ncbi:MAG: metal-dependent hydrolase, partial [Blastopirellula sp. JB062]
TMGVDDSIRAIQWIAPKQVVPAHYDTWPPIAQDAAAWAEKVNNETDATPHTIQPGEKITLG